MTRKTLLAGFTSLAVSLLASFATNAAPMTTLGISFNGGAITTYATDNGTGLLSYSNIFFAGTANQMAVSATAQSAPLQAQGTLLTNTVDTSFGAAGILKVYLSTTGLTSPQGINNFLSTFTSNAINGLVTSITEQTLVSTANLPYAGTQLGTATFTTMGTSTSTNASPLLSGPYSETVVYTITATGAGNGNATVNMAAAAVPEPASMALFGVGLITLGVIRRRQAK